LAIAVVSEVKANISLANMKLKHEDELDKSINVKLNYVYTFSSSSCFSFIFASDIFVLTSLTTAIAIRFNGPIPV
jgi:hypothetical protein